MSTILRLVAWNAKVHSHATLAEQKSGRCSSETNSSSEGCVLVAVEPEHQHENTLAGQRL